jgi:hypothetical protein
MIIKTKNFSQLLVIILKLIKFFLTLLTTNHFIIKRKSQTIETKKTPTL